MACSLLYQEFFSKAMQKESVVNTRKCNAGESGVFIILYLILSVITLI